MSETSDDVPDVEDERLRTALRSALRGTEEPPDVLAGFQK
jgi:hypothetical protein